MVGIDVNRRTTKKFDISKFLEFSTDTETYDVTYSMFEVLVSQLPSAGTTPISESEEYRPESVSFRLYEDDQYWWILLWYNDLMNSSDLRNGMVIRYPGLKDIEEAYLKIRINVVVEI